MSFTTENTRRSNHSIFCSENYGSPFNDLSKHISGLGLRRLDFERCAVAGEVIFAIEGDSTPTSQQDEEARIGTLAHALSKLGNAIDAAEFTRCLNAICEDGDALCRQTVARHYYGEIEARGAGEVLKEMALLAMQLASLNPETEEVETEIDAAVSDCFEYLQDDFPPVSIRKFIAEEIEAITRTTRSRRKASRMPHDEHGEWLESLVAAGASCEEVDDVFDPVEAMDQYTENGAIVVMLAHERTVACGRVDPEVTAEDLPECARHLAVELRRAYMSGVEINEIREEIEARLEVLFPVSGKTATGGWYFSHANRELQRFTRQAIEALLDECRQDFHLNAVRTNRLYRRYYGEIREAVDTKRVGETMKQVYQDRQSGTISVKHLIALKAAAQLQRERLQSAPLPKETRNLMREIEGASAAKVRYLSWAFYGNNQPGHPIHSFPAQIRSRLWEALKVRKQALAAAAEKGAALVAASTSSRGSRRSSISSASRSTAHSVAQA